MADAVSVRILRSNMVSAVALPQFISEYLRLYAIALAVAVIIAISLCIRRLPQWMRSVRASSWPIAQGTIESVDVNTVSGQALGELAYSYVANGERYSGYWFLQFANEQDAWRAIDPLKGQSIFVRYQSGNPSISAVRTAEQSSVLINRRASLIKRLIAQHLLELVGFEWDQWTRFAATSWPITKGQVESGTLMQQRDAVIWFLLPDYTAEVSYSYCVKGEYYSGHIARSFFRERSAKEFIEGWKDRVVFVRYKQDSPDVSVLRSKDQQTSRPTQYHTVAGA